MSLVTFFLALVIFTGLLAAIPFQFRFSYRRVGENDRLTVGMSGLLGLWRYKVDVPMLDWRWSLIPHLRFTKESSTGQGQNTQTEEIKPRRFNWWLVNRFLGRFFSLVHHARRVRRWFYKGIRCSDLRCIVEVGLEDAAHTGLLVGGLWSMLGYYLGKLNNNITFQVPKPQVAVYPSFCKPQFKVDIDCTFNVRIGHIIIAGFKVYRIIKLGLKGVKPGEPSH